MNTYPHMIAMYIYMTFLYYVCIFLIIYRLINIYMHDTHVYTYIYICIYLHAHNHSHAPVRTTCACVYTSAYIFLHGRAAEQLGSYWCVGRLHFFTSRHINGINQCVVSRHDVSRLLLHRNFRFTRKQETYLACS